MTESGSDRQGASAEVGIGIIGAGHFGAVHAEALREVAGARLTAVCRNDADAVAAFAARHGGTPHTDWAALLGDPSVDVVVIATPHDMHREIAVAALGAGKHVLLEKPVAATLPDCDAIVAAADRAAGLLTIGHVTRYFLPMQAAHAFLRSGRIGRPVAGTSAFVKLWMEENRRPWHLSRASGGGMLMTAGIHAVDRLVHLMGGEVASVGAMLGAAFHDQDADDTAFLNLRFADGRMGQVTSIGYRDGAVTSALQIMCEGGTLALGRDGRLRVGQAGTWSDLPCGDEPDPMLGALRRQWRAFLDAVAAGGPPPVSARYGRHMVAIIDAAARADAARREIAIQPPEGTAP